MATYSSYTPEVVQLMGGLDFVTPRPSTAPGALIDCYNFEVADKLGYKRIDGVEPFDGSFSISNTYNVLYTSNYVSDGTAGLGAGQGLYLDGDTSQQTFAIVTSTTTLTGTTGTVTYYLVDVGKFFYFYTNPSLPIHNSIPSPTNLVLSDTALATQFANDTTVAQAVSTIVTEYQNVFDTITTCVTTSYENDTTYYNPSIGLTWFKDRLYSVNDLNSFLFDTGTSPIYPGDFIGFTSLGSTALCRVRDVILLGGDWDAGTAKGKILYSDLNGSIAGGTGFVGKDINVFPNTTTSTPSFAAAAVARDDLTAITIPDTQQAGLFRSTNIDQLDPVLFPDPHQFQGWTEIDLGYIAGYQNGDTGSNDPSGFTKVGRDSNPPSTSIVASNYAFCTTATSGNLVDATPATNQWLNNPAATFPANLQTQNDSHYISTASNNLGSALTVTGFGFSDVPTDALVTGIELTVCAAAPPKTTTAATFVLPVPATPVTVQIVSLSGMTAGRSVRITDGTHTITGTPTSTLTAPNRLVFGSGVTINAGTAGDTMASGARVNYPATNRKLNASLSTSSSMSKQTTSIASYQVSATDTFVLGGSNDLWGATNLLPSDLQDAGFTLSIWCSGNGTPGTLTQEIDLDVVKMRVYYQTTSSVYYFYNGSDDVSATVTTYSLDSGDWGAGTAAGILQVANVLGYNGSTRNTIFSGDQIWTAPGGTGSHIADVATTMTYAGLPSHVLIQAQSSQYEFIEADFYGNTDWEAIYGVSGAGRAFTYDTFYFRYIYTGLNNTLDIPRHLAFHNFQLALGFKSGDLEVSATGLPEDFSGVDGAVDLSTGDPITGLLRMSGTTLGIFCQRSIQALNGTDPTNFSMSVLNPYEGAIEYTVVDGGNSKPIYASYRGISTFDQSNAYGNFLGSRLSANITPWLLPRLTGQPQPINAANNLTPVTGGPLFATTIRNKNQYRLWFADGYYLTLTLVGTNQDPVFTIQQINFNYTNTVGGPSATRVAVPLAHSSGIDSTGRDRNHFSIYNPSRGRVSLSTDYANYVWEIDRGWGFGPNAIRAWFTTTHNFFDNPFQIDNPRKVRLHGQSLGIGTLDVTVSADYESGDFLFGTFSATSNAPAQDISLPRAGGSSAIVFLTTDYQAQTNIANIGKRGRSFSLQFSTDPSAVEPPTVCQALLMQTTLNKADV